MPSQFNHFRPSLKGPRDGEILSCSFSLVTTALTVVEAQGATPARTTTGTYVVTFDQGYKNVTVGMSVQAASTAQLFIVTGRTVVNGLTTAITISQVTAGGGTAVDTITARIDLVIVARKNS